MAKRNAEKGFSLLEVVLVVAIVLIVSAMAIPSVVSAMYNIRLRSSAYGVAGLLQVARTEAIQANADRFVCYASDAKGVSRVWVQDKFTCVTIKDLDDPSQGLATKYKQVVLGGNVSVVPAFAAGSPATGLTTKDLGFAGVAATNSFVFVKPMFNARGIPCYKSAAGALCKSQVSGFASAFNAAGLWYFTDKRPTQGTGWAAVSLSPSGRVQVWSFDGTKWNK